MTGIKSDPRHTEKIVENTIGAFALSNTPPCARYEGGENNDRLIKVWTYVAGHKGGYPLANLLSKKIARLYDYKGLLVVATYVGLPAPVEELFRKAWVDVGREFEDQVEFLNVRSARWEQLWSHRRFESDWRP